MVELHLHLDGSLSPSVVRKIVQEEEIIIHGPHDDETLLSLMQYKAENGNLTDYLKCFDLPIEVLQSPAAVRYACMKLSEELLKEGIDYAEIRFAPQFHTNKGFSQEQILLGAIEAIDYASLLGIDIVFILCMMRGQDAKANENTLELAVKYFGQGVVALDLAGDEAAWPVEQYADLFAYARRHGIPFTIHAGEAAGAESIEESLRLGAWRIGHGVATKNDKSLMKYLAVHNIPLEMCPTSNLQTGAVRNIISYPIVDFLANGITVTINTDNRTVSDTNLGNEFQLIKSIPGYFEDFDKLIKANAEKAKFIELIKHNK